MPFGLFGGMVSATANLFSGVAQRTHEQQQQEKALKAQKEENELNRQWQERMWQEHESPQAQSQDMRSVGLNPAGNVGSQSVGSASTSSLPTPSPSQAPQFIARAGEAVANSLQAYRVMKLEQDKHYHQVRMDWKEDLYKQIEMARSREELDSILEERKESIAGMREDRRGKKINNDFQQSLYEDLEEARRFGFNRFKNEDRAADDTHEAHEFNMSLNELHSAYVKAQTNGEKASTLVKYAQKALYEIEKEVKEKTKEQITEETQILKNEETRRAAMHELEILEQRLSNAGIRKENYQRDLENTRNRILNGDIRTFGELGQFIYTHLHSLIPFSSSPLSFK